LAVLEGNDPVLKNEYVVIGAHLDHAGTMQRGYTCSFGAGNDPICNGADDNASGSITVLNQAKALAAVRGSLKRSVIFMWFSGEEEGLLGSAHYVRNPVVPLAKTVYMINVDMVGYLRTNNATLLALGGGTSNSGKRIIQAAAARYPEIKVRISDNAGGGSDHVNFMGRGIPGVFFHTGVSNNPNYHKTSDSPDKIDYDGMFVANKVIFETVLEVARASSTKDGEGMSLAGEAGDGFSGGENRPPLVTPEEMAQTCHHLMQNPYTR
jgi:Zn-dependent M28 family amino/carboxypeptidase